MSTKADVATKLYSLYSFIKHVTIISIILAVGVQKKDEIDSAYDKALCDKCFLISSEQTGVVLEFGICASNFNTGLTNITYTRSDSLLWPQDGFFDFKPISNYASFIYVPAVLFVIVVILGSCGLFAVCYENPSSFIHHEVALSFWMSVICLSGLQLVYSLFPNANGCYYSSASQALKTFSTVIVTITVVLVYGVHNRMNIKVRTAVVVVQFVLMFTFACIVVAEAAYYSAGSGDVAALALALICLISLIEAPLAVGIAAALWHCAVGLTRLFGIYGQLEANLESYVPSPGELADSRSQIRHPASKTGWAALA